MTSAKAKNNEDDITFKTDTNIMIAKYEDQFEDAGKIVRPWEELQLK